MKKILLISIFLSFLAFVYWFLTTPKMAPVYVQPFDKISEPPKPAHEVFSIIREINARTSEVRSIYVPEMNIHLKQGNMAVYVSGELALQKEKYFRLKITHKLFGQEMDIGSNSNYFWFWSKRMNPPYLHYAKHEDLNKTNLKTPLNPAWMIESLGLNPISTEKIEIFKFKENYAIIQPRISSLGERVQVMTLIKPIKKQVLGRYLYNSNGTMIASTEYQKYVGAIPLKILIIWYEENVIMDWDLSTTQKNKDISPKFWEMPNMINKINMGQRP